MEADSSAVDLYCVTMTWSLQVTIVGVLPHVAACCLTKLNAGTLADN